MNEHHSERPVGDGDQSPNGITIDCDTCIMRETPTCDDCLVSFIVKREPGDALVISADEARAMRALGNGGLVPSLRLRPRAG